MKLNRRSLALGLGTALLAFSFGVKAGSLPAPITTVQKMTTNVLKSLSANKNRLKSRAVLNSIVNSKFLPYIARYNMAQRVVGRRYWNSSSAAQHEAFVDAFKNMVVSTYAAALASYDGDKVRIYPIRGGIGNRSSVQVKTTIVRKNGQVIPVTYYMMRTNKGWRIYDFSVENISMVNSYRSQFAPVLASSGMNGLITKLQRHNKNN